MALIGLIFQIPKKPTLHNQHFTKLKKNSMPLKTELTKTSEVIEFMNRYINSFLVPFRKMNGKEVYRLTTFNKTPIVNVARKPVEELLKEKKLLHYKGQIILNEEITQL